MKRLFKIVMLLVVLGGLLTACLPQSVTQRFVELPDPLKNGFTVFIVTAITGAVLWLVTKVPFLGFLVPYSEPFGLLVASALLELIQTATPTAYGPVVILVLQLILLLLGGITMIRALRLQGVRGFRW